MRKRIKDCPRCGYKSKTNEITKIQLYTNQRSTTTYSRQASTEQNTKSKKIQQKDLNKEEESTDSAGINALHTWAIRLFNPCNILNLDSQIRRNSTNIADFPITIFLATSTELQDFNDWEIRCPWSASFADKASVSRTSNTCPGPSCSFLWNVERKESNFSSTGLLRCSFNQLVSFSNVSHRDWTESRVRDRADGSVGPDFFFLFPDGREERTQAWSTRPCQANGSETNCTRIGKLIQGVVMESSVELIFSAMVFSTKEFTIFHVSLSPSARSSSRALKSQEFKIMAKFNQSIKSEPNTYNIFRCKLFIKLTYI